MVSVTESIHIDAEPETVYALVADVGSVGRFSPEATGAVGAPQHPEVGGHFWGMNRRGPWFWATRCTVISAEPGRRFAFDVDVWPFSVSRWEYDIEPEADGCRVTETWTDRRTGVRGRVMTVAGSVVIPGPRDEHNRRNIRDSLAGLKRLAEAPTETSASQGDA
jgi:hypothetical protein